MRHLELLAHIGCLECSSHPGAFAVTLLFITLEVNLRLPLVARQYASVCNRQLNDHRLKDGGFRAGD
jgi:hypothetical protein